MLMTKLMYTLFDVLLSSYCVGQC